MCHIRPVYVSNYKVNYFNEFNFEIAKMFGLDERKKEEEYFKLLYLMKNGFHNQVKNYFGLLRIPSLLNLNYINMNNISPYEGMHSLIYGILGKFFSRINK